MESQEFWCDLPKGLLASHLLHWSIGSSRERRAAWEGGGRTSHGRAAFFRSEGAAVAPAYRASDLGEGDEALESGLAVARMARFGERSSRLGERGVAELLCLVAQLAGLQVQARGKQ